MEKHDNGNKWKLNIEFEYATRATLQQDSLVETSFNYLLNKARALMIQANVPCFQRCKTAQEAVLTSTNLDGMISNAGQNKTRYEFFWT